MSVAPIPIVGVSLGHRHQKTAISVTERVYISTGETLNALDYDHRYKRTRLMAHQKVIVEYHVRHLERHGPPSRYASVAQRIPEVVRKIGQEFILVIDMTATGRPAYSLILAELTSALEGTRIRYKHCPITVSGVAGGVSKSPDVGFLVPRRDLISASQILFDKGQLKIAEALPLARTLTDELLAFKPKAETPGDDLEGWREGKDDDLVLATALACWQATRWRSVLRVVDMQGRVRSFGVLPLSMNPNPYCIGLDLGQSNDYTALAIVETVGNDSRVTHRRSQRRSCP